MSKKSKMYKVKYFFTSLVFYAISILPFPVVYMLSDLFTVILNYLIPYRSRVIMQNLNQAFPEKSIRELRKLKREFYRGYCDIFFEGIKILTISEETVRKRVQVLDDDTFRKYRNEERGAINLTGHRGNFEYMGQIAGLLLPLPVAGVYRPFKSKVFEDFWREKVRHRFNTRFIPAKAIMKHILQHRDQGLYITFLNDQNPTLGDQHIWRDFLNKETIFFTAPAKIAFRYKIPVYFVDMRRTKRGHYLIQIISLFQDMEDVSEEDVITNYVQMLEKVIREDPANWLWSHKRWKYVRKDKQIFKEGYR